jgi:PAS domain S-box-containing protein
MEDHAIVVVNSTGTIVLWSPGAEKLFGYSGEEAIGRTLDLIVPEEYRSRHWGGFRQAMQVGTAKAEGQPTELPVICRTGPANFPARFTLLRNAKSAVIGAMAIFNAPEG